MFFNPDNDRIDSISSVDESENVSIPSSNSFIAPFTDGDGGEYIPRHLDMGTQAAESVSSPLPASDKGEYIHQPDGSNIAPNGAVIRNPWSEQPEIEPDNEYTPEKEDLNLLIM